MGFPDAKGLDGTLARCLRGKGVRYRHIGRVDAAVSCFREAYGICQQLGDRKQKASINLSLSLCAIGRGDLSGATTLLDLAQNHFHPKYEDWTNTLLIRAQVELLQDSLDQARDFIVRAMENDEAHHGGRRRFAISNLRADVEARTGNKQGVEIMLAEVTAREILPGQAEFLQFLKALRGQAYYAGIAGDIDGSRAHAARALLLASEAGSNDSYRKSLHILKLGLLV